ncbi:MAG: alpha/beta fold hydrolase [Actinomycetota bacterium]|nr:alpha/beta fold hydrolase [Actinomycetota bacterium]
MNFGRTPPQAVVLRTRDGVRLHAVFRPAGAGAVAGLAVVFGHGFTGSSGKPASRRVAEVLSRHAAVVAVDFRGHGRSAGRSTLGDREILDIDAAVQWARSVGYRTVVTVGCSMGGSVVVRHAAVLGGVDAVVSVSAPSRWYVRDTVPMRRVHWLVERRLGRMVARGVLGVRLAHGWDEVPESPVEVAGRIAPVPLLVVHGDADTFFPVEHPHALVAAAGDTAELWLLPGFGHAENAIDAALADRVGRWAAARGTADASGTIGP